MENKTPKPGLPIIRARQTDTDLILKSFAMSDAMDELLEDQSMVKRLSVIPNAILGVKMMRGRLNQLLIDLCATLPADRRNSILRKAPHMKCKIVCGTSVAKDKDMTVVEFEDLNLIAKYAGEWCKMCVDGNCNMCELGKAFDKNLTYDRQKNESWATWSGWRQD